MSEGNLGREIIITKGGTVLAGVRTKTITWGGESVDVTSGENDGIRCLLDASGQEQLDLPIEGIAKDDVLLNIALDTTASKMLTDIVLTLDIRNPVNTTPATITGNFRMSSYEEGAPYNDAITFSSTLESSGPWVYTPESA